MCVDERGGERVLTPASYHRRPTVSTTVVSTTVRTAFRTTACFVLALCSHTEIAQSTYLAARRSPLAAHPSPAPPMRLRLPALLQAATATDAAPFGLFDVFCVAVCLAGICVGLFADNQLRRYMLDGGTKPAILEAGLWRYSRHPNHFGEQMWWFGLLLLGIAAKPAWWYS